MTEEYVGVSMAAEETRVRRSHIAKHRHNGHGTLLLCRCGRLRAIQSSSSWRLLSRMGVGKTRGVKPIFTFSLPRGAGT